MKKFFVALLSFVMMFGSINAFSVVQAEPEYNTSISGDIVLDLNDDWQLGFTIDTESFLLHETSINRMYFQVYANVHIKGYTDAKTLRIQSAMVNSPTNEIEIDSNGNFDQEIKLILAEFNSIDSNIINFGANIIAVKGNTSVKFKIGKGELKTNLFIEDLNKEIDKDNDGINSLDFARFKAWYLDYLEEEYSKMENPESIKAYIYNEWYMKDFMMENDGFHFNSQTHLRAKSDAPKITLDLNIDGKIESYEYSMGATGKIDEIIEISGIIPLEKSSDVVAYANIKAIKGTREIEFGSTLRDRKSGDAVVGDVNYDKSVNSLDCAFLKQYILGMIDRLPAQSGFYCADVNDDKKINSVDFGYLKMYLLGMIDELPKNSSTVITTTPTPVSVTPTPKPVTPTFKPVTPTSKAGDIITRYYVGGVEVSLGPRKEITVEKSPENKIWISAKSSCVGGLVADGWLKTYFTLSGSAVNGVDYEEIDFDYFWRILGSDLYISPGDSNPQKGFYITPIDTDSDEPKDLEIYFGSTTNPAAIIHFVEKN
ncbi:MAG: Xyloglucanase Xgh74A precursor [Firmicutes bacterium ADurb.Bin419]|nr:MAG: Xyloglucanase Xgh74A precursor [Firmicutes bacterium ADurb.Bin419]